MSGSGPDYFARQVAAIFRRVALGCRAVVYGACCLDIVPSGRVASRSVILQLRQKRTCLTRACSSQFDPERTIGPVGEWLSSIPSAEFQGNDHEN